MEQAPCVYLRMSRHAIPRLAIIPTRKSVVLTRETDDEDNAGSRSSPSATASTERTPPPAPPPSPARTLPAPAKPMSAGVKRCPGCLHARGVHPFLERDDAPHVLRCSSCKFTWVAGRPLPHCTKHKTRRVLLTIEERIGRLKYVCYRCKKVGPVD